MSAQDTTDRDLRRFMFDDVPDNVAELRAELRELQGTGGPPKTRKGGIAGGPLFSEAVNKELAKHRPGDVQRKRNVVKFGLAFSGLAAFSLLALPEPLNWAMAAGCLVPFVVPLLKYEMAKGRARGP